MNEQPANDFETELLSRAKALSQQGTAALGPLYDLTAGRVLRYAYFLTRTRDEAEDVLQASFLRLARHPGKLCRATHPWAYLLKLVRNEAYTMLYRKKPLELLATIPYLPDPHQTADDAWERMESVRVALKALPAVQAEVITLKIWEGLTFREIAEVTQETLPAVTSRYRYGLEKLAEQLKVHAIEINSLPHCRNVSR